VSAAHTSGLSAMARRAVDAIILAETTRAGWTTEAITVGEMAEIIDRETAAPELLASLRDAVATLAHITRDPDLKIREVFLANATLVGKTLYTARAAIAKAEGRA
jgi:hypothetical protein